MKIKKIITYILFTGMLSSCNYLDVVPDNVATLDYAFRTPLTAEKYLFTCYSWLPNYADPFSGNPALGGGDELWYNSYYSYNSFSIAQGEQNIQSPLLDYWTGARGGTPLFRGIRECNIFLENIYKVKGLADSEKAKMSAEAKFLKAYYHFYLMRMYGPIPIMDVNLPISVSVDDVKAVTRQPIDEVVSYIVKLLDEAALDLPERVQFEVQELGRITKPIALSVKALVLVTAASPLFNGNTDFSYFTNPKGETLFNSQFDPQKWVDAATASKEAIDLCEALGLKLHYFGNSGYNISEATRTELSIRTAMTEKWNSEIIWGSTNSTVGQMQTAAYPRLFPGAGTYFGGQMAVPFSITEMFYSKNGVPIKEDKTWDYANRYQIQQAKAEDKLYIKEGYTTAAINFNREPRFYADLAFDGGRWYGQGVFDDVNNFYVEGRIGGAASGHAFAYSITGYWPKKVVNYLNAAGPALWTVQRYPWPVIRLADLYLLYAEALNEAEGPTTEVFHYLDLVRKRAGLKSVKESWDEFSTMPSRYTTKLGLKEIIHQERGIELAFEGSRYWDLRRWKTAPQILNNPIRGWNVQQAAPAAYYVPLVIFDQKFQLKDYFSPIKESELLRNKGLKQSPGW